MDYKKYIASVPNFPIEGILFRDITPLIQDGVAFNCACKDMAEYAKKVGANLIVGPESRGFLFGCPVAFQLGIGFVPIRKPNKLPRPSISESYSLEYGKNTLCIHEDAIKTGDKVVIVDDLLATGGTIQAAINLVRRLGGEVVGTAFIVELEDLHGRDLFKDVDVFTLVKY